MAETPTLRPLGVGEILDAGIKLYLRHWKPLMICVVGIVLPVQVLSALVLASVDSSALDTFGGSSTTSSANPTWTEIAAFIAVTLVSALSTLLATAACFKAVADAWLGSTPEAGRSLRFGLRRLPALIWLSIVTACGLVLAFLALVIPGIWLFVAWSLAVPVLLFERVGAFTALRRSFGLVRGRWWQVCGALLVGYLLATIVAGIVQLVPSGIAQAVASDSVVADAVATVVGGTVSSMISTPYTAAILTLLYFDQRVRKEGFDLQLLAEGLGSTRDPDAPVPAPLVGPDITPEQRAAAPYWPPPPGWVPPEPEPAAAPDRQWWQDPAPAGGEDESARYGGGYTRPQAPGAAAPPGGGRQSGDPLRGGTAALGGVGDARDRGESPDARDRGGSPDARERGESPDERGAWPGGRDRGASSDARDRDESPDARGESPDERGESPDARERGESSDARDRGGSADEEASERPKRDPKRADWLPPEAPRGPGGL